MIHDEAKSFPVDRSIPRFAGHVISVRTDTVVLEDDTTDRDVVVHPGAVGVIALDDRERVLLVQQYRHPPQQLLWEPPAGLLDQPGETALECAARELAEEAGHRAGLWSTLVDAFTSPGMTDEAIRIYLAREIEELPDDQRTHGVHEERDMPTAWVALDDLVGQLLAGHLHNPMLIIGTLAAAHARTSNFTRLRPADAPWPERAGRSRPGS